MTYPPGMRLEHHFPVVASMTGREDRLVHLTVGPHPDDPDTQATVLWAWSKAMRTGFAWVTTAAEPEPIAGRQDAWNLDGPDGLIVLRSDPYAACCGEPLKSWRPPNMPRARTVSQGRRLRT